MRTSHAKFEVAAMFHLGCKGGLGMKKLVFVLSKTATSECGILVRVMLRDGSRARALKICTSLPFQSRKGPNLA